MKRCLTVPSFLTLLLSGLLLTSGAHAAQAEWVREPAISPDGRTVAFVSRGQVRVVPVSGGASVPLTPQGAYSSRPTWSPDSRRLAFASDVAGDDDVYVAQLGSGQMERRTFSSAWEVPTGFSPDGQQVLYLSARLGDVQGSRYGAPTGAAQLYSTPAGGGRSRLLIPTRLNGASWNKAGTRLLYAYDTSRDPGARQHRVAANAGEVWLYDPATRRHTPLVRDGHDARNPVWAADGQAAIYYLSERSGTLNVWRRTLGDENGAKGGTDTQITRFSEQPVRGLSISAAGDLAFTWGGRLYVLRAGQTQPVQVPVEVSDFRTDAEKVYVEGQSSEFQVSPDGRFFALAQRGNLFLLDKKGRSYPVTRTPQEERDVTFSPDGGFLIYASARKDAQGQLDWRLYKTRLPKDSKDYALAGAYTETLVQTGPGTAQQPQFSPDGRKVAFVYERREVRVLDVKTGKVTTLYQPGDWHTSYRDGDLPYRWSPDSRHLLLPWRNVPFSLTNRWAVVPADGSSPLKPISGALAETDLAEWSRDGTQILAFTRRDRPRQLDQNALGHNLYRIFMSDQARTDFLNFAEAEQDGDAEEDAGGPEQDGGKAQPGKARAGKVQAGKVQAGKGRGGGAPRPPQGTAAPTPPEAEDEDGDPDEKKAEPLKAYTFQTPRRDVLEDVLTTDPIGWYAALPDRVSVLVADIDGDVILNKLNLLTREWEEVGKVEGNFSEHTQIQLGRGGKTLYIMDDGEIKLVDLEDVQQVQSVSFELTTRAVPSQVRAAAFDQAWLDLKQTFYRADMHGVDWSAAYRRSQPYLQDIATTRELADLIDELGGSLSASHLFPEAIVHRVALDAEAATQTATLGLFYDTAYAGEGFRIAGVLPGGPLDRTTSRVRPGDLLLSVNGQPIPELGGLDRLLDGQVNRKVRLGLRRGQDTWTEEVTALSLAEEGRLNTARTVAHRRAEVERLSGGTLAYTYLPAMDNSALITTYNDLLSLADQRVGAVLDVRGNSGGDLNRQLINFLSGKPFAKFGRENRPWATDPTDRWQKSSALLVDSFAYSDGSVFPQSYQDARLGPVIGELMLNTGTGVNYISSALLPELGYSVPIMPMRRLDGRYYENNVIRPEVLLPHDPNAEQAGRDLALEAAVKALLKK